MTNTPRISIIVTFYNLENCVEYCLNSILDQEYQDYEVICVDDGSKDATFYKLLQYVDNPRVRILRQRNGGLSKARNTGIKYARGEYLSFIDGDDIVSPFYLSSLLEAIEDTHADIAIGTISFIPEDDLENAKNTWARPKTINTFSNIRAAELMLCHKLGVSACAKLVPKNIYGESFFLEGRFHEDIASIILLFSRISTAAVIQEPIYKYLQRQGSIMHGFASLEQRSADLILAVDHLTQICREMGVDESYIELYRCIACLMLHNNGGKYIDSKVLRNYVRKHLKTALSCKDVLPADRLTIWLFAFGIFPYDFIRSIKLKIKPNL